MTMNNEDFTDACITMVLDLKREGLLDALASLFEGSGLDVDLEDWTKTIGKEAATALMFRVALKKFGHNYTSDHREGEKSGFIRLIEITDEETEKYIGILKELSARAKTDPSWERAVRVEQIRTLCRVNGVLDRMTRDQLRDRDLDERADLE